MYVLSSEEDMCPDRNLHRPYMFEHAFLDYLYALTN